MAGAGAMTSRATAMAAVQAILDRYNLIVTRTSYNGFDRQYISDTRLIDASSNSSSTSSSSIAAPSPIATATFELTITEFYSNLNNVMHGGAAGIIFDMSTTCALGPVARPGFWDFLGGVTRTLNISYLKAIPVGTKIHIHSTVLQVGRTMAMISGRMMSVDGKTIYCTCEHHKVAVPTRAEHLSKEFEIEWDRLWRDEKGKL